MHKEVRRARAIASFAERYEKFEFLPSMKRVSCLLGSRREFITTTAIADAWLEDPLFSLASACWYGYARQGAPPRYWRLAAQAVGKAANQVGQYDSSFPTQVWNNFVDLCQHPENCIELDDRNLNPVKPNWKMPTVRDLASLHLRHRNLMRYMCENIVENAAVCHSSISSRVKGMSEKTTAFLLRDVAWVYGLDGKGSLGNTEEAVYIQPVDVWVGRVSECLWPDLKGKDWRLVAKKIIEESRRAAISPIHFNQGAWYLGAREVKDMTQLCPKLMSL